MASGVAAGTCQSLWTASYSAFSKKYVAAGVAGIRMLPHTTGCEVVRGASCGPSSAISSGRPADLWSLPFFLIIQRREKCWPFRLSAPSVSDWRGMQSACCTLKVRCLSDGAVEKTQDLPARLVQKQQLLDQRIEESRIDDDGSIPKITEEQVTVSFARSGGPGGQNVNKVNTKVDMRFNVMAATWLPERIKLKILEKEKNRINSDGELVVSSTRTRTQKGNLEDALQKIQTIIDAAAYVPPPPSEEKQRRIKKLAKADNEKRLDGKKKLSSKKSDRRSKGSWD